MKKITKILLSVFVPVVCVLSLTLGLAFGIKKNADVPVPQQEQQEVPVKYDIPGVYYASPQEVTGAVDAPLTAKAGSIYVGSGSSFTMSEGAIRQHAATFGGAIYVANNGTFTMTGGAIAYNQAKWGGAIYVEAGGTCNLLGGSITGNASEEATAVYVEDGGTLVVDGCTIINNYTELYGNYIDFYVDGVLNRSVSLGQNNSTFNLADAPLDYEHCPGYFTDQSMVHELSDGGNFGTDLQSAVATGQPGQIYSLYTRTATLEKLSFVLNDDNNSYSVCKNSETPSLTAGSIVIPRQYNGKNVTEILGDYNNIGAGAFYGTDITEVFMPNTIKYIGYDAFWCDKLTDVVVSSAVTNMGTGMDYDYLFPSSLKNITIHNNFENFYPGCFNGATFNIYYDGTLEEWLRIRVGHDNGNFSWGTWTLYIGNQPVTDIDLVIPDGIKDIYNGQFCGWTAHKKSVTIPTSVRSIGDVAGLWNIDKVYYEGSLKQWCNISFGHDAFRFSSLYIDGQEMKDFVIPSDVTTLNDFLFCGLNGSIYVPSTVTSFSTNAFYYYSGLIYTDYSEQEAISAWGDGWNYYPSNVYYNTSLEDYLRHTEYPDFNWEGTKITGYVGIGGDVVVPDEATVIGEKAFYNNTSITGVTLPSSVLRIENDAFNGCSELRSLTIPASVISFGDGVFSGCTKVTNASVPFEAFIKGLNKNSLTTLTIVGGDIMQNAFSGRTNLVNVTLENGVTSIGEGAFYGCTGITSISIPNGVSTIPRMAFFGCTNLESVTFGNNIQNIAQYALSSCSKLTNIYYEGNIPNWFSISFASDWINSKWNLNSNQTIVTEVTVPSSVTSVPANVFDYCISITKINIPSTVSAIGTYAFRIFEDNGSLDMYYAGSLTDWCGISFSSYWVVENSWKLYISNTKVTNIAIPSGITAIPDYAFYFNGGITSVTMSDSVETVGTRAFMRCYNLETVIIGAGVTSIGDRVFNNCNSLEKIYIPSTVITIVNNAGTAAKGILAQSSTTAQIYTDLTSQANIPAGWDQYFNYYDANTQLTVNYNVTKQQFDQM